MSHITAENLVILQFHSFRYLKLVVQGDCQGDAVMFSLPVKMKRHNYLAAVYLGQLHEARPSSRDEPQCFQRTIHELREDVARCFCRLSATVHL